jgi:hypothetical protein
MSPSNCAPHQMVRLWSRHVYTKTYLEVDRLERFELLASSNVDAIDRQEVLRRPLDAIIQIPTQHHVRIFTVSFLLRQFAESSLAGVYSVHARPTFPGRYCRCLTAHFTDAAIVRTP